MTESTVIGIRSQKFTNEELYGDWHSVHGNKQASLDLQNEAICYTGYGEPDK